MKIESDIDRLRKVALPWVEWALGRSLGAPDPLRTSLEQVSLDERNFDFFTYAPSGHPQRVIY